MSLTPGFTVGKVPFVVSGTPNSSRVLNGVGAWVSLPSATVVNTDTLNFSYDVAPDWVSPTLQQSPPQQRWARIAGTNYVVSGTGQATSSSNTVLTLILSNGSASTRNYQVTLTIVRMFSGTTLQDSAEYESGTLVIPGAGSSGPIAFTMQGGNGGFLGIDGSGNPTWQGSLSSATQQITWTVADVS